MGDAGRLNGFQHQVVENQQSRAFARRERVQIFRQPSMKTYSQRLESFEDGLPMRSVTIDHLLKMTRCTILSSKIVGCIAYQSVKPSGLATQRRTHNLHVGRDLQARIVTRHASRARAGDRERTHTHFFCLTTLFFFNVARYILFLFYIITRMISAPNTNLSAF